MKIYQHDVPAASCNLPILNALCHFFFLKGNYDSYVKTRAEVEENQMKQYSREQDQIKHMKVHVIFKFKLNAIP